VKARLQKWELAKDLRYKELWNKRHPALANPKSRNEGKVHRIKLSAEPGKLHRQITYASSSSPRSLFQPTEIIGGWLSFPTVRLSRLPQPAVLSNVNWARPRSVSVPAYLNSKSDIVLQQSCPQPLAESPFRRGSESHPTPVSIPRPPRTLPIRS
jgi:hypothetical protein